MELFLAIDLLDGKVVRLAQGNYDQVTVYHHNPVDQARAFEQIGATWLHVVDLNGARSGVPAHTAIIEEIMTSTHLQVEVGGGIRSLEAIHRLRESGATRVVLGSRLATDPVFAQEAIAQYGELLCAGIDARAGQVAVSGWEQAAQVTSDELLGACGSWGYQHVVYTDIARDGMQTGIDVATYSHVADVFGNPVTVSGGVSTLQDIEALAPIASQVEGVISGRALYEGTLPIEEALMCCRQMSS